MKPKVEKLKSKVEIMRASHNTVPGLAVVLVGERPDSAQYVRMKKEKVAQQRRTKKPRENRAQKKGQASRQTKNGPITRKAEKKPADKASR